MARVVYNVKPKWREEKLDEPAPADYKRELINHQRSKTERHIHDGKKTVEQRAKYTLKKIGRSSRDVNQVLSYNRRTPKSEPDSYINPIANYWGVAARSKYKLSLEDNIRGRAENARKKIGMIAQNLIEDTRVENDITVDSELRTKCLDRVNVVFPNLISLRRDLKHADAKRLGFIEQEIEELLKLKPFIKHHIPPARTQPVIVDIRELDRSDRSHGNVRENLVKLGVNIPKAPKLPKHMRNEGHDDYTKYNTAEKNPGPFMVPDFSPLSHIQFRDDPSNAVAIDRVGRSKYIHPIHGTISYNLVSFCTGITQLNVAVEHCMERRRQPSKNEYLSDVDDIFEVYLTEPMYLPVSSSQYFCGDPACEVLSVLPHEGGENGRPVLRITYNDEQYDICSRLSSTTQRRLCDYWLDHGMQELVDLLRLFDSACWGFFPILCPSVYRPDPDMRSLIAQANSDLLNPGPIDIGCFTSDICGVKKMDYYEGVFEMNKVDNEFMFLVKMPPGVECEASIRFRDIEENITYGLLASLELSIFKDAFKRCSNGESVDFSQLFELLNEHIKIKQSMRHPDACSSTPASASSGKERQRTPTPPSSESSGKERQRTPTPPPKSSPPEEIHDKRKPTPYHDPDSMDEVFDDLENACITNPKVGFHNFTTDAIDTRKYISLTKYPSFAVTPMSLLFDEDVTYEKVHEFLRGSHPVGWKMSGSGVLKMVGVAAATLFGLGLGIYSGNKVVMKASVAGGIGAGAAVMASENVEELAVVSEFSHQTPLEDLDVFSPDQVGNPVLQHPVYRIKLTSHQLVRIMGVISLRTKGSRMITYSPFLVQTACKAVTSPVGMSATVERSIKMSRGTVAFLRTDAAAEMMSGSQLVAEILLGDKFSSIQDFCAQPVPASCRL